jgi:putative phosphoesterase
LFHAFHKDERCEEYGEQDLDFLKWRDDKIKEIKPDYVITGHTHIAGVYEKNGVVFINPGSLNFPRFPQEHPSYIIGTDNDDGNFDWNVKFIK